MKAFLVALLAAQALHAAVAQDRSAGHAEALRVVDVVGAAGQPEAFFQGQLGAHVLASFHYGLNYDLTYLIDGGLLTVQFFDGKAGYFRLVLHQARASAEALPLLLGVDTALLRLTEATEVKKVWRGRLRGVAFLEVAAVTGPAGWHMAEVKLAGYPHD